MCAANSVCGIVCVLNIQLLELALVLGCIFFTKLVQATNQALELSWAHTCMFVRHRACLIERPIQGIVNGSEV